MEEDRRCSVNRIRRFLVRTADVHSSDGGDPSPALIGVSGNRELKLCGFVGSITTVVAAAIFMTWAYVPDNSWFYTRGICHYPSRYWELPVPTYLLMTVVVAIGLYSGMDLMAIPPPISLESMFDEYGEEPESGIPWTNDDEQHIGAISKVIKAVE